MVVIGCCEAIIAIFLPPLAVLLRSGCGVQFFINILLTLLGWLPGVIHAWFVIAAEPGLRRRHSHSHHSHSHHHSRPSSRAGHGHHHHHGHHTGRHHPRPARRSLGYDDRPVYRESYYSGGGRPRSVRSGYGPPPPPPMQETGYAYAPPRRY
ncbi:hypothetical protein WHR41_01320 [Cladosporium halotolerans]|uniref:Plasma membrane proteolipid 3 n=1 Tax=Cladosporium halotolerans TaxID=1052096 RepID=A0AB34L1B4_9PEZI